MKKTIKDYFSESDSREENWDNAVALMNGISAGMRHSLDRISSYHSLLELELEDNPSGKIYVEESKKALKNSINFLNYLESFSKASPLTFESIDLKVLIKAVIKRFNKIGHINLDLSSSDVTNENIFINGSLFLLRQVFFDLPNLIKNGEKNSPTEVSIHCEVEKYDDDLFKSRKSYLKSGEFVKILMHAKDFDIKSVNLLSTFEKLNQPYDQNALDRIFFVYGAILEHGGDMFFEKEEKDSYGLCAVLLPIKRNQVSMFSDTNIEKTELKGNETILLVDDEDIIWDVVIDMLHNMGYTVVLAANGNECVEIYRDNPGKIDLVLLDMIMPELSGHESIF